MPIRADITAHHFCSIPFLPADSETHYISIDICCREGLRVPREIQHVLQL